MGWVKDPEFRARVEREATKHIRSVSMKVLRGVVVRTPVDTGRLKGNWQVGIDSAPSGTSASTSNAAISKGGAMLKRVTIDTKSIYIVNNLPYAVPIEEGHGGRNPGVMVKATLAVLKLS